MPKKICLITGVGPATGTELAHAFKADYKLILLARDKDRLEDLSQTIPGTTSYSCDLTSSSSLDETLKTISKNEGTPDVIIHNAVGAAFGNILNISPETLEENWKINTIALLNIIQHFAPKMVLRGSGAILATGNTSAYRGRENFAAFAPTKAAQRILMESAARHLNPQGVHCCYVAIDGVIDGSQMRQLFPDKPENFFCQPKDIAQVCYDMAHQARSTWAFDIVVRPDIEVW